MCHVYLFMSTRHVLLTANSRLALSPLISADTPLQSWDNSVSGKTTAIAGHLVKQRIKSQEMYSNKGNSINLNQLYEQPIMHSKNN